MKYCMLQVSDNLLNPDDESNPADVYFKAIWSHLDGEGYYKPDHFWEIPLWIAELSYCLQDHELILHHITREKAERLPDADIYFGSILDCNKDYFRVIARNNPEKFFFFGGYIGREEFYNYFFDMGNISWCDSISEVCDAFQVPYKYGTDYSLFKGMKCIPRLTLSNGCTNHCRFCTMPDEIIQTSPLNIVNQIYSMEHLDFELVYINDKTFGQCQNYYTLESLYNTIKEFNPKFRGFTVQTTCAQVLRFMLHDENLKDLHIVNIELGVESYNDDILKKYQKPQSIKTIDKAIDMLEWMGVNIIPNIIIGLPGENIWTYSQTLEWLDNNKHKFLMLNVTNFVPYIGSDASDIVKTQPEDLNQTICERSYHTEEEAVATEVFSEFLFELGMEIIKNTKAGSV